MAPQKQSITISSHNVNGFSHSKEFLSSLCNRYPNAIRGIQEHWLAPPFKKHQGVNRLRTLHPDFDGYGTSGMKKSIDQKVRTGRPYGGTGFLYNKKYSNFIKPLLHYNHERVSAIKLTANDGEIIIINAYLPYFNTKDFQNQFVSYQESVSYIDHIIESNPSSRFLILTDMNCNIFNVNHPYSKVINDLMKRHSLFSTFDLMSGFDHTTFYTRSDTKTNSFTLIDGILASESLRDSISNVRISDYGENVSDHRPVELDIDLDVTETFIKQKKIFPTVNWSKLSTESKNLFRVKMTEKLDEIVIPFHLLVHGDKSCSDLNHRTYIESYYSAIVDAVVYADSFLPRSSPSLYKPFWNDHLNELKQKSINCCDVWKCNGSPRSGELFECKKRCVNNYKRARKDAKMEFLGESISFLVAKSLCCIYILFLTA